MSIDEAIELLAAFKAGKTLETTSLGPLNWEEISKGEKVDVVLCTLGTAHAARIKPEPHEWFIGLYEGGIKPRELVFQTKEDALNAGIPERMIIHVREVL